jgi:hypothetical protein
VETKVIYQTLKDKGNPKVIKAQGPFPCNRSDAWFGYGYYFWDTYIENAHWWGQSALNDDYIITQATCDFSYDNCFDIVGGHTPHMKIFYEALELIRSNPRFSNVNVPKVIEILKRRTDFKFDAIRGYGINSISNNGLYAEFAHRLYFNNRGNQYVDCQPAIQFCLFRKTSMNFRNYMIIYPECYLENIMV